MNVLEISSQLTLPQNNSQELTRRNTGFSWYVNSLPQVILQGMGWVANHQRVAQRIEQVGASATELTEKVTNVAGKYISSIKNSTNPAEFFPLLNRTQVQEIFFSSEVHQTQTYEAKLLQYRGMIKDGWLDGAKKDMALRIFRGLGITPAYRILRPYLPDGSDSSLSRLFKADREAIKRITPEIGQGWLSWGFGKVLGVVRLFDPIKDGNFPFLIGTRKIEGKEVSILRHPLPTVEFGTMEIAPEYKAFLANIEDGILYDCLLQLPSLQVTLTSGARIELLYKLGEEYPDVFHFIRMPFDGPLVNVDNSIPLESYKETVKAEIKKSVNFPRDQSNEFIFGSARISGIVNANYEKIIDFAYGEISKVYPSYNSEDYGPIAQSEKEKKQVFMMFVQTLLRNVLIKGLGVGYYGNTCKHSSDRGAVATGCDLIWSHFLTGTLKDHIMDLRLTTAYPAFMAKSSAVEELRAELLDAYARFIEAIDSQGGRDQLVENYKALGFPLEEEMSYYRPKICYPQSGAEIHVSIQGQEAKRKFVTEIPFNPDQPQAQLLDKLLEIFEDQYNLSFVRIGDEGFEKKRNNEEPDHYLAESRFVVCDVDGRTYGELNFTIAFPISDLESTVLHAKIESNLEAVTPYTSELGIDDGNHLL